MEAYSEVSWWQVSFDGGLTWVDLSEARGRIWEGTHYRIMTRGEFMNENTEEQERQQQHAAHEYLLKIVKRFPQDYQPYGEQLRNETDADEGEVGLPSPADRIY